MRIRVLIKRGETRTQKYLDPLLSALRKRIEPFLDRHSLNFFENAAIRKKLALQTSLILIAGLFVAIFISSAPSRAENVASCSAIQSLRNGGFDAPSAGVQQINAAGATYPATTVTGAQNDSSNGNANAVYGQVGGSFWNHLDASADGSSYRTYALGGTSGDARIYWRTTEASEQVEVGSFVTPYAGSRFAELNANVPAALYQDIPTVPGVTIRWSLAHRGRDGTDTMRVSIGKPSNSIATVRASASRFNGNATSGDSTLQSSSTTRTNSAVAGLSAASAFASGSATSTTDITDGQTWRVWYGVYEETSTTTTNTRFLFQSITPSSGGSGNLLDAINFDAVAACPISRIYNSPTASQTISVFDTNAGSFAMVPDETGGDESVTALTLVSGPGRASINSDGKTLAFTPNGIGTTEYDYTIRYVANGIASTSSGRITIVARDIYGQASCSPGSFESSTAIVAGQTTVIETFKAPTQANTDNDSDHRSGTCTWTVPEGVFAVDYLVVGGGGGGASGGGGGGGVVTSWSTSLASSTGTSRGALRNPLAVSPGQVVDIKVGGGGKPGWGGSARCTHTGGSYGNSTQTSCTMPTRISTNGSESQFGSVTAAGGGYGGGSGTSNGGDGGSGGGSRYDASASSGAASASQVVGASSYGNIGGGSTLTGGYRAGGGGGGAGTAAVVSSPPSNGDGGQGGLVRITTSDGGLYGSGQLRSGSTSGGGGHGGRGVAIDIASFSGTFSEYGCGGGGGINDNSNNIISGAGGTGGCATAGNGSSWGTFLTTTTNSMPTYTGTCFASAADGSAALPGCSGGRITSVQFNGTTVPTEGFGGGGGGTDPEAEIAGSGGSGVVVIRYAVSNVACPNSSNATDVTGPIACPYPITIFAGAAVATQYNLSYGDATNGYVSFPGGAGDTVTVTTTIGNNIDTVAVTVSGNLASFAVSNVNTALAGATYPMRYTIYSGSSVSTSFVLLKIADPSQATPVVIPVDPQATYVDLSAVKIGGSQMTQVCFTPVVDNDTPGYANVPSVDRIFGRTTETRTVTASSGRLRLQGSSANLQTAVKYIRVTKNASDAVLLPGSKSRKITVNVSNQTVGGNGSCTFGNESIIELKPMVPRQTIRGGIVGLKPGN